jgi:putative FmdB family regulatory protein
VPTYSYACTECGHEFDAVQSIRDATLTSCPSCQGALRKVFHPVGVAFKGSGFYRTDSRADSKAAAAKAGDSGKGPGGGAAKESSSTGSTGSSGSDSTASSPSKKEPAGKTPGGSKGSAPSKTTSSSSD